ncbi:hypothetical protein [Flavobacterium rhizosphaerae]|uniref:Transcription elongation factor, GreA/GreB, C-term n=1 Tax=Flavobacterium rhizosphaerae TaxID=3163298 RepID=A0ABW8Z2J9_9FLAO
MKNLKPKIVSYYKRQVQDKLDAFHDMVAALTEDAANDAKGSAGDKHETALSMMHLEQEKLNHKIQEFLAQKAVLDKIDPNALHKVASLGSLVKANGMYLFISAALPKITIEDVTVIALSPQSPMGSLLMGKGVGENVRVNTSSYTIEKIV